MGMNRLRHAYVQLAPELEPYFIPLSAASISDFVEFLTVRPQ
jgi:hypothetical protein